MSLSSLKVAVVCMSNMNRSMEAHSILRKKGFSARSFGAGSRVRLPGTARNLPVVYDFSTTYEQMRKDLVRIDRERYTSNGILHILGRNEESSLARKDFKSAEIALMSSSPERRASMTG
ncbi:hypothetical protein MJT46_010169 [Ovis ammon polii x Ovis aries]|nr:hypothetical protein MJT46_010169 [Ovis ammon polii x Ovis aries]